MVILHFMANVHLEVSTYHIYLSGSGLLWVLVGHSLFLTVLIPQPVLVLGCREVTRHGSRGGKAQFKMWDSQR